MSFLRNGRHGSVHGTDALHLYSAFPGLPCPIVDRDRPAPCHLGVVRNAPLLRAASDRRVRNPGHCGGNGHIRRLAFIDGGIPRRGDCFSQREHPRVGAMERLGRFTFSPVPYKMKGAAPLPDGPGRPIRGVWTLREPFRPVGKAACKASRLTLGFGHFKRVRRGRKAASIRRGRLTYIHCSQHRVK
jgi:hypothetical protein